MSVGALLEWISIGTVDAAITFFRASAMAIGAGICAFLVLRPEGRSAARGAALALLTIVVLGPVVQPWYLLWVLPLLAATGLSGTALRATMLLTAVLVVHGMAESNATADTLVDFIRDGAASAFALGMVIVVLLSSPGERRLLIGHPVDRGIRPDTPQARIRAGALVIKSSPHVSSTP
jgi:alpha-1,6-mannosyltransferase